MDDYFDSTCSTPFASAPSSPGRSPSIGSGFGFGSGGGGGGGGYFFSAPASPIHHLLLSSSASTTPTSGRGCHAGDAEFEFGGPAGSMISADELFHNGQIRPLTLPPLPDLDPGGSDDDDDIDRAPARGRDLTPRCGSVHRRARSLSPLRSASPRLKLVHVPAPQRAAPDLGPAAAPDAKVEDEAAPPVTASSRSSSSSSASSSSSSSAASAPRGSRRWVLIKDMLLLHRSKSKPAAGRGSTPAKPDRAWPFSPAWASHRDRVAAKFRAARATPAPATDAADGEAARAQRAAAAAGTGTGTGTGRRGRRGRSSGVAAAHERLYAAPNRAQAEEMRRRTFLPYRQGLLGCLGFSSRGYGALHGLTKTLNPVFSR